MVRSPILLISSARCEPQSVAQCVLRAKFKEKILKSMSTSFNIGRS